MQRTVHTGRTHGAKYYFIMTCLADIDRTTIDVVRIGTQQHLGHHPVVGVVPGSLSWQKGVEVAYRYRSVLLEAGLDIHWLCS